MRTKSGRTRVSFNPGQTWLSLCRVNRALEIVSFHLDTSHRILILILSQFISYVISSHLDRSHLTSSHFHSHLVPIHRISSYLVTWHLLSSHSYLISIRHISSHLITSHIISISFSSCLNSSYLILPRHITSHIISILSGSQFVISHLILLHYVTYHLILISSHPNSTRNTPSVHHTSSHLISSHSHLIKLIVPHSISSRLIAYQIVSFSFNFIVTPIILLYFYLISFHFISFIVSVTWPEWLVPARQPCQDTTTTRPPRSARSLSSEAVMPTGTFLEAKGFAILSARYVMVKKLFICIYVHFLR